MSAIRREVGHVVFDLKFGKMEGDTSFISLMTKTTGKVLFSGIVDDQTADELRAIADLIDGHGPYEAAQ